MGPLKQKKKSFTAAFIYLKVYDPQRYTGYSCQIVAIYGDFNLFKVKIRQIKSPGTSLFAYSRALS